MTKTIQQSITWAKRLWRKNTDQQFLDQVTAYIEQYISKQVITLAMAGDSMQMSHATIHDKVRTLTGLSGSEFILKVRLRHSLHLMIDEHRNISQAADESGFKNTLHFRNCFEQEYGMTPSEYLNNVTTKTIVQ